MVFPDDTRPSTLTRCVDLLLETLDPGEPAEKQKRVLLRAERMLRGKTGDANAALADAEPAVRQAVPSDWTPEFDAAFQALNDKLWYALQHYFKGH